VLFKSEDVDGILNGRITLAFRRWMRPSVKAGGTLRIPGAVLAIEAVDVIEPAAITDDDAQRAGRASRAALLEELEKRANQTLYRIRFHLQGADERVALREQADLTEAEMADVLQELRRMDSHGGHGPWTRKVLSVIRASPRVLAARLAKRLGFETLWFKTHVRKLKALGLTESLEIGYQLSPRGRRVLERIEKVGQ
jgi:hypothetical protein